LAFGHWLLAKSQKLKANRSKGRFWQAGGGFDRNLWNPEAIHRAIYSTHLPFLGQYISHAQTIY